MGKPPGCRVLFLTLFNHYRLPHVMYYLALNEADEEDEEMRDCEKQRGKVDEWTQLGSKSFLGEEETIEVEEEESTMASIPLGESSPPEGQS